MSDLFWEECVNLDPGAEPERRSLEAVDTLRTELEAFADAIEGRAPYPVTTAQMIDAVAAMEAINRSMETGSTVTVGSP